MLRAAVVLLAVVLARRIGWPDDQLAAVGAAALLHDLGAVLAPERPALAAFGWLLERSADDFWLRCALVARNWREPRPAPAMGGSGCASPSSASASGSTSTTCSPAPAT